MEIKDINKLVNFRIVSGKATKTGKEYQAIALVIEDKEGNCFVSEFLTFLSPKQYENIVSLLENK